MKSFKNTVQLLCVVTSLIMLVACEKPQHTAINSESVKAPVPAEPQLAILSGNYCFYAEVDKDTTEVNLNVTGSQVTGTMSWIPFEKDRAVGKLKGAVNAAGELDLMYDYMIEGNQQTETKVMKIENDQLMIKRGELIDLKNDGHLVYKDVATATYKETLPKVECKS